MPRSPSPQTRTPQQQRLIDQCCDSGRNMDVFWNQIRQADNDIDAVLNEFNRNVLGIERQSEDDRTKSIFSALRSVLRRLKRLRLPRPRRGIPNFRINQRTRVQTINQARRIINDVRKDSELHGLHRQLLDRFDSRIRNLEAVRDSAIDNYMIANRFWMANNCSTILRPRNVLCARRF